MLTLAFPHWERVHGEKERLTCGLSSSASSNGSFSIPGMAALGVSVVLRGNRRSKHSTNRPDNSHFKVSSLHEFTTPRKKQLLPVPFAPPPKWLLIGYEDILITVIGCFFKWHRRHFGSWNAHNFIVTPNQQSHNGDLWKKKYKLKNILCYVFSK